MGLFDFLTGRRHASASGATPPKPVATGAHGKTFVFGPPVSRFCPCGPSSSLPRPPGGYTWHTFRNTGVTVLRPDGWHAHQVDDGSGIACMSKECIQTEGSFITGLTVQAIGGNKDNAREKNPNHHPDLPLIAILEMLHPGMAHGVPQTSTGYNFLTDPAFQLLYADQGLRRHPGMRMIRFQYRHLARMRSDIPWHGPLIIQKSIIDFDDSKYVYHFCFESPESSWAESWHIGKQILTNLVFSKSAANHLIFSIDPPLPAPDVLQDKALEVGRAMGFTLAYENGAEGLFAWRVHFRLSADASRPMFCCYSWYMKRVENEIWVHDPITFEPLHVSDDVMEQVSAAAKAIQEEFKSRWLDLVGPVTLQGPSPETHSTELQMRTMMDVVNAAVSGDR